MTSPMQCRHWSTARPGAYCKADRPVCLGAFVTQDWSGCMIENTCSHPPEVGWSLLCGNALTAGKPTNPQNLGLPRHLSRVLLHQQAFSARLGRAPLQRMTGQQIQQTPTEALNIAVTLSVPQPAKASNSSAAVAATLFGQQPIAREEMFVSVVPWNPSCSNSAVPAGGMGSFRNPF